MSTDFFNPQDLSFEQVKVLTHGMMAVARADGIHDNEMSMIREFYDSCSRIGDPRLEDVAGGPFDPADAAEAFSTPEERKLFIKSMILLAFADGNYAKVEDELVRSYAAALEVSPEQVDALHEATKEFLLASLSHIKNVDALVEVQRRLSPEA